MRASLKPQELAMVQYVGVQNMVRLIGAVGIEPYLIGLAGYIEADFRRWPAFEKVPRVASHSRDGVIELMPTSDGALYAFKYVNGHPKNTRSGLQTVTAFGVLSDVDNGYPRLLSEMTITTALRTAATSALAARYLARKDASVMAIIGLGAQSEFQALAFKALLGIRKLRVFDVDPAAMAKFLGNMTGQGFEIEVARTARDVVIGADIITTVTADKLNATILSDDMVEAGVHINAVGGDCPGKTELQREILLRADVFVELPEQTRIEGEIQQMPADFPVTELWRVIAGETTGRRNRDQITLFDSVGFATEDFSALRYLSDRIEGTDFYDEIDLVTEPEDPRDLFGLLRGAARVSAPMLEPRAMHKSSAQASGVTLMTRSLQAQTGKVQ
jgi:ornithine cyclodeaminase